MISHCYFFVSLLAAIIETTSGAVLPNTASSLVEARDVWQPETSDSWQIVLSSGLRLKQGETTTTPGVSVFDIDLFGNDASTISALHDMGKKVICYFSAGTREPWTPDADQFEDGDLGKTLADWSDETWIDTRSANVRKIMSARILLAQQKGCDGVDPDNVDAYNNDNGLGLSTDDAIDYLNLLANEASASGLSIGLKNALEILPKVSNIMQFAVNEACAAYQECGLYSSFLNAGKPVFHIEYPDGGIKTNAAAVKKACYPAKSKNVGRMMSSILKNNSLDGKVQFCDSTTATTAS